MLISATDARKNFFELLNRVLYGNEEIFVTKSGSKSYVRLEKVESTEASIMDFAGTISDKDAKLMKDAIAKARKYPKRKVKSFD
jgi:antitoxin (DNA-binding transcriptional repressor) of toxin-antitoxin stability system